MCGRFFVLGFLVYFLFVLFLERLVDLELCLLDFLVGGFGYELGFVIRRICVNLEFRCE